MCRVPIRSCSPLLLIAVLLVGAQVGMGRGAEAAEPVLTYIPSGNPFKVAFSPDGKSLACNDGGRILLFDLATTQKIAEFDAPGKSFLYNFEFLPSGKAMLVLDSSGLLLWTLGEPTAKPLAQHALLGIIMDFAISPDGSTVAIVRMNEVAKVGSDDPEDVQFTYTHPQVTLLSTADPSKTVDLQIAGGFSGPERVGLAFSKNGQWLVIHGVVAKDDEVRQVVELLDLSNRQSAAVLDVARCDFSRDPKKPGVGHCERYAALSPNGKTLATGKQLYDVALRRVRTTLKAAPVTDVEFSADGRWIVTAGTDRHLALWDAETGGKLAGFRGHRYLIKDVGVSPDGRWIASCANDKICVWDAAKILAAGSEDRKLDELAALPRTRPVWQFARDWSGVALEPLLPDQAPLLDIPEKSGHEAVGQLLGLTVPDRLEEQTPADALRYLAQHGPQLSKAIREKYGPQQSTLFTLGVQLNMLALAYRPNYNEDPTIKRVTEGLLANVAKASSELGFPPESCADLKKAVAERKPRITVIVEAGQLAKEVTESLKRSNVPDPIALQRLDRSQ